jgi:hypothetical protein
VNRHNVAKWLRRALHRPSDVLFAVRIGWFIWRCPSGIERHDLAAFLADLRKRRHPSAADPEASRARIVDLRGAWLRLRPLRTHDTCYVRAITLYRFLDAPGRAVRIHFGVESGRRDRLHGHAWVTLDGVLLEGPPEVDLATIVEVNVGVG